MPGPRAGAVCKAGLHAFSADSRWRAASSRFAPIGGAAVFSDCETLSRQRLAVRPRRRWKRLRQASSFAPKKQGDGRMTMARWLAGLGAACVAAFALSHGASAQDYPARTVKIIVPFPAGGTADAMPRIVADYLSKK